MEHSTPTRQRRERKAGCTRRRFQGRRQGTPYLSCSPRHAEADPPRVKHEEQQAVARGSLSREIKSSHTKHESAPRLFNREHGHQRERDMLDEGRSTEEERAGERAGVGAQVWLRQGEKRQRGRQRRRQAAVVGEGCRRRSQAQGG